MLGPVGAVVLPALERVLAERPRLLLGFREDRELADAFASSLGGARSSCRIEHPLDDRGVLSAVGSLTELAAEIGGADGGDGLDPVIGGRGRDDVAAGGADPEGPYMVRKGDGGLDVLDTLCGVLEVARGALALALVGGVEGEGNEALAGQTLGVKAGCLLLHAACGVTDHDRRAGSGSSVVGGVEVSGELQASAGE
jgi:hypothetical protein